MPQVLNMKAKTSQQRAALHILENAVPGRAREITNGGYINADVIGISTSEAILAHLAKDLWEPYGQSDPYNDRIGVLGRAAGALDDRQWQVVLEALAIAREIERDRDVGRKPAVKAITNLIRAVQGDDIAAKFLAQMEEAAGTKERAEASGPGELDELLRLASGDTGGGRRVAAVLLSLWNGFEFHCDLQDLVYLDRELVLQIVRLLDYLNATGKQLETIVSERQIAPVLRTWGESLRRPRATGEPEGL